MRRIRTIITGAALLVALGMLHASAAGPLGWEPSPLPEQPFPALGPGQISCATYTKHVEEGGIQRERDKAWILGFVTGYNYFQSVPKYKSLFMPYDTDNVIRWVDGQCSKKPDARLVDELHRFIRSLMKLPTPK
jgi:hypothetical protein